VVWCGVVWCGVVWCGVSQANGKVAAASVTCCAHHVHGAIHCVLGTIAV
jgi:hypothetical protein